MLLHIAMTRRYSTGAAGTPIRGFGVAASLALGAAGVWVGTRDMTGNIEAMAMYAGEGVGLIKTIESASAVVLDLAAAL
jgi:hypothetical protein